MTPEPLSDNISKDNLGADKRVHKRIVRHFMARFQIAPARPEENIFTGWDMVVVQNLGAGGLFFCHNKRFEAGTLIDLVINFPAASAPIDCVGKIVRVDEPKTPALCGVGVSFVEISKEDKNLIDRMANEL
ncbi:PilZ domain-containing protein [Candidatus Omnitrophota bacterium]